MRAEAKAILAPMPIGADRYHSRILDKRHAKALRDACAIVTDQ